MNVFVLYLLAILAIWILVTKGRKHKVYKVAYYVFTNADINSDGDSKVQGYYEIYD